MRSTAEAPPDEGLDQPSVAERLALIERVAASAQFGRSARLRDFLLYVGRQSLKDGCPEIHEQEIGFKVFGRPASYDRSQDNIVRVNATELRKRIDLYFATEGAHEPLIIEVPRGGYKPIFHRRLPGLQGEPVPEAPRPDAVAPLETPVTPRNRTMDVVHIVWTVVTMGLVLVCVFLFQQERAMRNTFTPGTASRPSPHSGEASSAPIGRPTSFSRTIPSA